VFSPEAEKVFSPLELVKEVHFTRGGLAEEEIIEATNINWLDKKDNPVAVARRQRQREQSRQRLSQNKLRKQRKNNKKNNNKDNNISQEREEDDEEDDNDNDNNEDEDAAAATAAGPWSFFEWFSKEPWPECWPDVGEVIRREIWHSPVAYFLGDALSDEDEDDDEEDDEDDDDDDDDDEEEEEGLSQQEADPSNDA
ncbi:nucleosome assembly domain-containing protein, putative, partial [Eimeria acervulina]